MKLRECLLLFCALLLPAILLVPTLDSVSYQKQADEGFYLFYARHVAKEGPQALPGLFQRWVRHPTASHLFPAPNRVAVVLMDALAVRLLGPDYSILQRVSVVSFFLLLLLVFLFLLRTMGEEVAFWTTLLLSVSPLHLGMARRALADCMISTLFFICLWLFIEALLSKKASSMRWIGVAAAYLVAFLSKEFALVLMPLSLSLILWFRMRRGRHPTWQELCAITLVPIGAAGLITVLSVGGVAGVFELGRKMMEAKETNPYALAYGQGPWFRYLVDLFLLSPFVTLGYLLWVGYLLANRSQDDRVKVWTIIPILFFFWLAPMWKNVRNVMVLEVPMRLGTVLFLRQIVGGGSRSVGIQATVLLALVVSFLVWMDMQTFRAFFVEYGIYDPMSVFLLSARGFLPLRTGP